MRRSGSLQRREGGETWAKPLASILPSCATFVAVDTEAIDAGVRDQLRDWAVKHAVDAIVSTDGDADRPLVTDARGEVIPGDVIGPLVAQSLGAGVVVTTVSANTIVERLGMFSQVHRTRIGSPYVIEKMLEFLEEGRDRVVGYEPNGGFLLGTEIAREGRVLRPLMTRDAVLPIVGMMALAKTRPLRDWVDGMPARRTAFDASRLAQPCQVFPSAKCTDVRSDSSRIGRGIRSV